MTSLWSYSLTCTHVHSTLRKFVLQLFISCCLHSCDLFSFTSPLSHSQNFRSDIGQCPLISQPCCVPDHPQEKRKDARQVLPHRPCREREGGWYIECWPPNSSGGSWDQQKPSGSKGLCAALGSSLISDCHVFSGMLAASSAHFCICLWTVKMHRSPYFYVFLVTGVYQGSWP